MAIENDPLYSTGGTMLQANSPVTTPVATVASSHQYTIGKGAATAGTVTLTACPVGSTVFEPVYDQYGAAIVYNAATSATQITYVIDGRISAFKETLSGGNGAFLHNFAGVRR